MCVGTGVCGKMSEEVEEELAVSFSQSEKSDYDLLVIGVSCRLSQYDGSGPVTVKTKLSVELAKATENGVQTALFLLLHLLLLRLPRLELRKGGGTVLVRYLRMSQCV